MNHQLRYLSIAIRNGAARFPLAIAGIVLVGLGWVAAVVIIPGPEDQIVHYLSLVAAGVGLAAWLWFHLGMDLRSKYPPVVLLGGGLCILLSAWCLWREFSPGLLVRLSLPLFLLCLLCFYAFYFSMYFGKQRISRLQPGDHFPHFALPDSEGRIVTRESVLARGPALLLFYKGDW